jgi:predicted RNase H-like nuclease
MVLLAGVDLAWQSTRNPTAIAFGSLENSVLTLTDVKEQIFTAATVLCKLHSAPELHGIAIDGPLIINNETGQRACERSLSREYGSRHASCHASNLTLYPNADGVRIAAELEQHGFKHLGQQGEKWQLECYPHPALIEIFQLPERLKYKKGRVAGKRKGQQRLAELLLGLKGTGPIRFNIPDRFRHFFDSKHIASLRGRSLKHNEDVLDSVVCLHVAALYQSGHRQRIFGDIEDGYVVVPDCRD